jgi:hypothetical protein
MWPGAAPQLRAVHQIAPKRRQDLDGSGGYPGDEILAGSMWVIYVDVGMFIPTKQMLNR